MRLPRPPSAPPQAGSQAPQLGLPNSATYSFTHSVLQDTWIEQPPAKPWAGRWWSGRVPGQAPLILPGCRGLRVLAEASGSITAGLVSGAGQWAMCVPQGGPRVVGHWPSGGAKPLGRPYGLGVIAPTSGWDMGPLLSMGVTGLNVPEGWGAQRSCLAEKVARAPGHLTGQPAFPGACPQVPPARQAQGRASGGPPREAPRGLFRQGGGVGQGRDPAPASSAGAIRFCPQGREGGHMELKPRGPCLLPHPLTSGLGAARSPRAGQRGQGCRDQAPAPGVLVHLEDKAVPRSPGRHPQGPDAPLTGRCQVGPRQAETWPGPEPRAS